MESGDIINEQIDATSQYALKHADFRARLNRGTEAGGMQGAWSAAKNEPGQFIQVHFVDVATVKRVATQGRAAEYSQWVTKYKLQYREPGNGFTWYDKVLKGNIQTNKNVN